MNKEELIISSIVRPVVVDKEFECHDGEINRIKVRPLMDVEYLDNIAFLYKYLGDDTYCYTDDHMPMITGVLNRNQYYLNRAGNHISMHAFADQMELHPVFEIEFKNSCSLLPKDKFTLKDQEFVVMSIDSYGIVKAVSTTSIRIPDDSWRSTFRNWRNDAIKQDGHKIIQSIMENWAKNAGFEIYNNVRDEIVFSGWNMLTESDYFEARNYILPSSPWLLGDLALGVVPEEEEEEMYTYVNQYNIISHEYFDKKIGLRPILVINSALSTYVPKVGEKIQLGDNRFTIIPYKKGVAALSDSVIAEGTLEIEPIFRFVYFYNPDKVLLLDYMDQIIQGWGIRINIYVPSDDSDKCDFGTALSCLRNTNNEDISLYKYESDQKRFLKAQSLSRELKENSNP